MEGSRLGVERFDFGAQNTGSGLRSQEFVKRGLTLNLWGVWQKIEWCFVRGLCRITAEEFLRRTGLPLRLLLGGQSLPSNTEVIIRYHGDYARDPLHSYYNAIARWGVHLKAFSHTQESGVQEVPRGGQEQLQAHRLLDRCVLEGAEGAGHQGLLRDWWQNRAGQGTLCQGQGHLRGLSGDRCSVAFGWQVAQPSW